MRSSRALLGQDATEISIEPSIVLGSKKGLAPQDLKMNRRIRVRFLGLVALAALVLGFLYRIFIADAFPGWTIQEAREATLRMDLFTMREAIAQYRLDKKQAPHSLNDLVDEHYLPNIPVDPLTMQRDWVPHFGGTIRNPSVSSAGLDDVHSASLNIGKDGTAYNTW